MYTLDKFRISEHESEVKIMHDFSKLIGLIIEKCESKRNFAKKMELSETSIYMKLHGKVEFKPSEIEKACEILGIDEADIPIYFFTQKVQKN